MSLSVQIQKQLGDFHLSVRLETGAGVWGLLGASGSGKSKTLQCIAGIERPDQGRIVLNGRVLFDAEKGINVSVQQRRVGYLFQNYALFPTMSVEENIACGARFLKNGRERRQRVQSMIRRMQLTGLEHLRLAQLSGGQQQRTALARCLINEPEILLLDEPFSALDVYLKEQLMGEMTDLLGQFHKDVIVVTHNREEAYQLCDHLAILADGQVDACGTVEDVFAAPETRAGAILTGCKNIVPARKAGATTVAVPDWGLCLETGRPVPEAVRAIAIREQAFSAEAGENEYPVEILKVVDQPFSRLVQFRYRSQTVPGPLTWRLETGPRLQHLPEKLGVAGTHIILLYR